MTSLANRQIVAVQGQQERKKTERDIEIYMYKRVEIWYPCKKVKVFEGKIYKV